MNKIARLSFVAITAMTLGLGFASGANALPGVKAKGATLNDLMSTNSAASPEIAAAETRVEQAKAQVDMANKQVSASRALLKAAQADLKAATAQVEALKANATAQGLVDQTGMTPAKAPPVSIAAKAAETKTTDVSTTPAVAPTPAQASGADPSANIAPAPAPDARINAEGPSDPPAEPIMLR